MVSLTQNIYNYKLLLSGWICRGIFDLPSGSRFTVFTGLSGPSIVYLVHTLMLCPVALLLACAILEPLSRWAFSLLGGWFSFKHARHFGAVLPQQPRGQRWSPFSTPHLSERPVPSETQDSRILVFIILLQQLLPPWERYWSLCHWPQKSPHHRYSKITLIFWESIQWRWAPVVH